MLDPARFRRPLGLAMSGAGSLGAWQAGLLQRLVDEGLHFDRIWGFSAGALNGVAYFSDRVKVNSELWQSVDPRDIFRVSPKHWPSSLFSDGFIRNILDTWVNEEEARAKARCSLHVVSYHVEDSMSRTWNFEPGGRWDGSLRDHVAASCAIPFVFPPVKIAMQGKTHTFLDGGVPGKDALDLEPLKDCKDILVVSITRPEEVHGWEFDPTVWISRRAKRLIHHQMSAAARRTSTWSEPPRLHSLVPSRPLRYSMLNFSARRARAAFHQGAEDAYAFLHQLQE